MNTRESLSTMLTSRPELTGIAVGTPAESDSFSLRSSDRSRPDGGNRLKLTMAYIATK